MVEKKCSEQEEKTNKMLHRRIPHHVNKTTPVYKTKHKLQSLLLLVVSEIIVEKHGRKRR